MERITNEEINRNIKKEEYRQFLLRITEGHPSHEVLKKLYSHDELKKVSESDKNFFLKNAI